MDWTILKHLKSKYELIVFWGLIDYMKSEEIQKEPVNLVS